MRGCNYFRDQIDEADKPDLLSFEVSEHLARCSECERFAAERAGLRRLLASETRVAAPVNFDAVLRARLAEANARRAFAWLSPAGYLRLGAATAGLVVMAFAAQYAGLFSTSQPRDASAPGGASAQAQLPELNLMPSPLVPQTSAAIVPGPIGVEARIIKTPRIYIPGNKRTVNGTYITVEDGGVVLVRGQNSELDVPMPTVSVGAQPLLYVSAGRRPAQTVGASF